MMHARTATGWLVMLLMGVHLAHAQQPSRLWGKEGELWNAHSRLPDFSFAGYRGNNERIPAFPRVANVRDLGAKGDGTTDDTAAFLAALNTTSEGVIFIPAGRYRLTQVLHIKRSRVVLQGENRDNTTLFFPSSLTEVVGPGKKFAPGGAWSWSGGFISVEGNNQGESLTEVTKVAARADTQLQVRSAENLSVGQNIRVIEINTDGKLGRLMHDNEQAASEMLKGRRVIDFACQITAIVKNTITLNRPLRIEVRPEWKPIIASDLPTVENVGIENITIAFPVQRYAEHHEEPGLNAIAFQQVSNSWVRNVRVINSDAAILLQSSTRFCTVERIELTAEAGRARDNLIGHHGVLIGDMSQDNRIEDFDIQGLFIHDLCVSSLTNGNVFAKGRAENLSIDHHRKIPYENLFTDIDAGRGDRLWLSGGDEEAGPHAGARETFWNIRAGQTQTPPPWAVQTNLVAVTTNAKTSTDKTGTWIEAIDPTSITPSNLFAAQLERRQRLTLP